MTKMDLQFPNESRAPKQEPDKGKNLMVITQTNY